GIKRYMLNWIEHGGRVAIWTRDMSWAQNPETRRLLTEKARRNELILCLPELNELARERAPVLRCAPTEQGISNRRRRGLQSLFTAEMRRPWPLDQPQAILT